MDVETLEGKQEIEVPPGSQFGDTVIIPGMGVPHLKGVGRGDLIVQLRVVIPKKLNKEQKELLQKFAETGGEHVGSGHTGFLGKLFGD